MTSPTIPTTPEGVLSDAGEFIEYWRDVLSKSDGHDFCMNTNSCRRMLRVLDAKDQHYTETAAVRDNALAALAQKNLKIDALNSANKAMREALDDCQFLLERLDEFDLGDEDDLDDAYRNWNGHVDPAIGRLRASLRRVSTIEQSSIVQSKDTP